MTYYFHVNTNIDFQIFVSVPLNSDTLGAKESVQLYRYSSWASLCSCKFLEIISFGDENSVMIACFLFLSRNGKLEILNCKLSFPSIMTVWHCILWIIKRAREVRQQSNICNPVVDDVLGFSSSVILLWSVCSKLVLSHPLYCLMRHSLSIAFSECLRYLWPSIQIYYYLKCMTWSSNCKCWYEVIPQVKLFRFWNFEEEWVCLVNL